MFGKSYKRRVSEMSDIPFERLNKLSHPILSPGLASAWDSEVTANPRIFKYNGQYINFYTGYSQKATYWGIGYAFSEDLVSWHRPDNNLLICSGGAGSWNHANVDGAWVLPISNSRYGMFYEGRRFFNTFETQSFGFACTDTTPFRDWQEFDHNPVFSPTGNHKDFDGIGLLAPLIYRVKGHYWMFYSGFDGDCMRTGVAFSKDLLAWERYSDNPIIDRGPNGGWDAKGAVMLNIFRVKNQFYAFYEGRDEKEKLNAGLVTSNDLLNWERVTSEPVLKGGDSGSFDEQKLCSPYVFIEKGKLYLFFGAHPVGEVPGTTGLAIALLKHWAQEARVCFDEISL